MTSALNPAVPTEAQAATLLRDARGRPDLLRRWLQAELEAQRFMADPRNADEVIRAVARHLPGESERALRLALHGAYPESQGGAVMRRVFPFEVRARADLVPR